MMLYFAELQASNYSMATIQRFKAFEAPKRFIFKDPDTHYEYVATTKKELWDKILNYRLQNQLPLIPKLDWVLEDYWCGLKENCGKCERVTLERGWYRVFKGGVVVLENLFFGDNNMVSPEVAQERAEICVQCPLNVFPDKSAFMAWADSVAEASTGGKKTELNDALGNCAMCSCTLRAKVWAKGPFELTEKESKEAPEFCWQLKERKV